MDQEIKEKWVKALRSGEYQQGHGYLQTQDGKNCCLGVLLRMQGLDVVKVYGENFDYEDLAVSVVPEQYSGGLSPNTQSKLAAMNDGDAYGDEVIHKHSFDQIADYIEKFL